MVCPTAVHHPFYRPSSTGGQKSPTALRHLRRRQLGGENAKQAGPAGEPFGTAGPGHARPVLGFGGAAADAGWSLVFHCSARALVPVFSIVAQRPRGVKESWAFLRFLLGCRNSYGLVRLTPPSPTETETRRIASSLFRPLRDYRYRPVTLSGQAATWAGVPAATMRPPAWPPPGPRSMR